MRRGKNQVLFKYLPGKPIDYNQGNAIALVERWYSQKVTDISKVRILREVFKAMNTFGESTRGFPRIRNYDSFELLSPSSVEAELFPLTFVCEKCNRAYTFGSIQQISRILRKHRCNSCNGKLTQMDLIYYHECGHLWAPKIAACADHGFESVYFDKCNSDSPQNWRWRCGKCNKIITSLNSLCPTCKKIVYPTPFRQSSVFTPHSLTLVHFQNLDEDKLYENEIFRKLILAEYLELFKKYETSFEKCWNISLKGETKANELREKLSKENISPEIIEQVLKSYKEIDPDTSTIRNKILSEIDENIKPFNGDSIGAASKAYEFMETLKKSSAIHIDSIVANAIEKNYPNADKIKKSPESLKSIGVKNAYVLNDLSIIKLVYGFTRGSAEKDRILNRFVADKFMDPSKVPIYLNNSNTEAILLELDRWSIMKWLQANGVISDVPDRKDEVKLKSWFLNNIDPEKISLGEIDEKSKVTKEVYKLLHSISHALMITGSVECGLDKNSLGELILPLVPAIIIYSSNAQKFPTGGMFTLFENNISPWVSKTLSKVENCIYDPVCMNYQSACHACLYLSEISCTHFNNDLGRDILISKKTHDKKIIGFLSSEFKKTLENG